MGRQQFGEVFEAKSKRVLARYNIEPIGAARAVIFLCFALALIESVALGHGTHRSQGNVSELLGRGLYFEIWSTGTQNR
jgi:hypothetical protein